VASKADIFRLAWLYEHGGIYADADEKLVGRIESVIPPECSLLLTWAQGIPPCIQNGFIAVQPQNPLIESSLMLAVKRIEHEKKTGIRQSAWIQTGPGVVSMAVLDDFAIHGKPVAATGLHLMRDPVHRMVVQSDEFLEYRRHPHGNWRLRV
jgi:mannosyltransferase OCH1-like enzyme